MVLAVLDTPHVHFREGLEPCPLHRVGWWQYEAHDLGRLRLHEEDKLRLRDGLARARLDEEVVGGELELVLPGFEDWVGRSGRRLEVREPVALAHKVGDAEQRDRYAWDVPVERDLHPYGLWLHPG